MTRCPPDATLQEFITGVQPPADAAAVEAHVEECERCRRRLDVLSGVTALSAVLAEAAVRPRVESPSLMMVMERLQLEATSVLDTPSQGGSDRTFDTSLPVLQPPSRDGLLGTLGAIEIRRVIGRGGMGVVYEGLDTTLNRTVAVKVLSPHLLADDAAKERFHREAQVAAAFTHENVVTIHAIDRTPDGTPYLVFQHVPGESLADRLTREGRLPADEVARIGAEIAHGLAALHASGLVHRDIKPANVLLEASTGRVRLTDFGLAKLVGGETITGIGTLAGTPAFMSPEQAAGADVDPRSDLFSLGALLYTAACGRLPFSGDSPYVILNRVRTEPHKPLAEHDPTIPAWFCALVDRLLEKERDARIQSASEVAELLERQAVPPPIKKSKRRWVATVLLAGVVLAVVGFFVFKPTSSTVPTDAEAPTGFEIVGRNGRWPNLGEAVEAAADGDTIVVRGDGLYSSPRIDIRGKKLTIRAAEGGRPHFVPNATTKSVNWLTTDADLTLEDISVDWPGNVTQAELSPLSGDEAVVASRGRTVVRRCRIVSGIRMACVACDGALNIESSHLVTDGTGGGCVIWKPGGSLTLDRTVMEGRNGVIVGLNSVAKGVTFAATGCTFRTDSALMYLMTRQAKGPIPTDTHRCVFDTQNVVTLYYIPPYQVGGRPSFAEMRTAVKRATAWTESENVYRRKASYLTAWAPQRPQSTGDIKAVADWLEFWARPDVKSIEGDLRFAPRSEGTRSGPSRLEAIDEPSGPVPDGLFPR